MTPEKIGDKLKGRVERGIAIPKKVGGHRKNEWLATLEEMKVKESILCEGNELYRCQSAINTIHERNTGMRFTGRLLGANKKRFWRTE